MLSAVSAGQYSYSMTKVLHFCVLLLCAIESVTLSVWCHGKCHTSNTLLLWCHVRAIVHVSHGPSYYVHYERISRLTNGIE